MFFLPWRMWQRERNYPKTILNSRSETNQFNGLISCSFFVLIDHFFKINKICIVDWHTVHCSWCWQCSRRPHQSGVHKGGGQVTPRSIGGWQLPGSDRQNCPQEQSPVSPHSGGPGSYRRSDWKPPRHSQEGMYLKR